MFSGSGESKSQLAKAAGAEPAGQMRDEKVHAVVARSKFRSQNVQNTSASDHFWKLRCQKVHAVVARSTFWSQNVQNTPCSDHFWKLRRRKSARRRGAKYISKSKCTKHTIVEPLLQVEMSKKCTPLWRESGPLWTLRCRSAWQVQAKRKTCRSDFHYTPLHYTTLHYTTLDYIPLHYTTLHSTTLHYTNYNYNYNYNYHNNYNYNNNTTFTLRYTTLH